MRKSIKSIKNRTLSGCIIIYIFSYFISLIGVKIVGKNKFNYISLLFDKKHDII